jgi:hypothetical protein
LILRPLRDLFGERRSFSDPVKYRTNRLRQLARIFTAADRDRGP